MMSLLTSSFAGPWSWSGRVISVQGGTAPCNVDIILSAGHGRLIGSITNPERCLTETMCEACGSLAGVSVPAEGPPKLNLKGCASCDMPNCSSSHPNGDLGGLEDVDG